LLLTRWHGGDRAGLMSVLVNPPGRPLLHRGIGDIGRARSARPPPPEPRAVVGVRAGGPATAPVPPPPGTAPAPGGSRPPLRTIRTILLFLRKKASHPPSIRFRALVRPKIEIDRTVAYDRDDGAIPQFAPPCALQAPRSSQLAQHRSGDPPPKCFRPFRSKTQSTHRATKTLPRVSPPAWPTPEQRVRAGPLSRNTTSSGAPRRTGKLRPPFGRVLSSSPAKRWRRGSSVSGPRSGRATDRARTQRGPMLGRGLRREGQARAFVPTVPHVAARRRCEARQPRSGIYRQHASSSVSPVRTALCAGLPRASKKTHTSPPIITGLGVDAQLLSASWELRHRLWMMTAPECPVPGSNSGTR